MAKDICKCGHELRHNVNPKDMELAREICVSMLGEHDSPTAHNRCEYCTTIASALCLSESRGVKKGMMKAAEIADKHICKPRREEDGPCMCAIVVQCEIEEAIRQQAESEEE